MVFLWWLNYHGFPYGFPHFWWTWNCHIWWPDGLRVPVTQKPRPWCRMDWPGRQLNFGNPTEKPWEKHRKIWGNPRFLWSFEWEKIPSVNWGFSSDVPLPCLISKGCHDVVPTKDIGYFTWWLIPLSKWDEPPSSSYDHMNSMTPKINQVWPWKDSLQLHMARVGTNTTKRKKSTLW